MDILQINKFYYIQGGADRYFFELSGILEERGHRIMAFAMHHARNLPSPYSRFFVSEVDLNASMSPLEKLRTSGRIIYSLEAQRKMEQLLSFRKPDIAHFHNIYHQLSPSILHALERHAVPTVMTAHDYKLVCPNYLLFDRRGICNRCAGGRHYRAVLARCVRGSFFSSLVLTAESYLHRILKSYDMVRIIIAPSQFMKKKLMESGIAPGRIVHIPNFVSHIPDRISGDGGDYISYAGRLSREKGVETLIRAMKGLDSIELRIAGTGPSAEAYKDLCARNGIGNVKFMGHLDREELFDFLSASRLTVVPSEVLENCPLSVLEAMAIGKPVIGSALGGIPELIDDGEDGLLFTAGNEVELRTRIAGLYHDRKRVAHMGEIGRDKVKRCYSREVHCRKVEEVYERAAHR